MPDSKTDAPNAIPPAAQAKDRTDLAYAAFIAVGIAGVLLILVVLPAEHGIDPTGFGRITGLDQLSGDGAEIDWGDRAGAVSRVESAAPSNHTFTFELAGLQDNEYKLYLLANQSILYTWRSTSPVNFDFHGDPDHPSRPGESSSYEDSQATSRSGSFQAPFDGRHGWYFQNVNDGAVSITLEVWGYYEIVGLLG